MKCSECGANISIVSGRWRGRSDVVYGRPQNAFRGTCVCTNGVRVFRKALEERLLTALQEQVIRQEAVEYVLDNFETEFLKAVDNLGGELEQMRRRKEELEREIVNLTNFVAQGECSPGLRAALVDRERQISEITARLLDAHPDSLRAKLRNIRGDRKLVVGSNRLLGAASGDSEPAAFLKTKCVTLSVGFHTAIWNQHAVGMSESLCGFGDGICGGIDWQLPQFHEDNQLPTGSSPQKRRN